MVSITHGHSYLSAVVEFGHVKEKPNNGTFPVTPNRFDYQRCMEMNENGAKHVDEDGDGKGPKIFSLRIASI